MDRGVAERNVLNAFVRIAFIIGLVLVVLVPPFQSPDEDSHFKKSYTLSEGVLFPTVKNGKAGFYLPKGMSDYISDKTVELVGKIDKKVDYQETLFADVADNISDETEFRQFSTVQSNPIAHLAPAFGMVIGKILIGKPGIDTLLYFGRIANLCMYIFMVAYAIRSTPKLKSTICFIGLMPMSLFLGTSLSYDGLLIASSLILFAKFLFYLESAERVVISKGDQLLFAIIAYFFIAIKIVYLPLFIVLLILPKRYYCNWKVVVKTLMAVIGGALLLYLLYSIPCRVITREVIADNALMLEQASYVMHHPVEYIVTLFRSLRDYRDYYIRSFVGVYGLLDTQMYSAFSYLFFCYIWLFILSDMQISKIYISVKSKLMVLIGVCGSFFGIFLAMYLAWTVVVEGFGVGARLITGVQGRYFIPNVVFLSLLMCKKKYKQDGFLEKAKIQIINYSHLVSVAMLIAMCIFILLRFWC